MNDEQTMQCPACPEKIPFDAHQLVLGARFSCPGCGATVGLTVESASVVQQALRAREQQLARLGAKST